MERNSRKLIALLKAAGWVHVDTRGDHWQFKHPTIPGRVTIAHPVRDIKVGTVASIYRQTGWK
jgi:predicted RNA binding protein YcfA (HicA-like mRNA interferase family)